DDVALLETDVHGLDDTGSGGEHGPGRHRVRAAEPVDDLRELALELARAGGSAEDFAAGAVHAAGQLEGVGILDLVGSHDHGPEREAAVVDLRLRQVERVLALDVPGGDVVGQGVAEDGAAAADHDRELGLGGGEGRIAPAPDR